MIRDIVSTDGSVLKTSDAGNTWDVYFTVPDTLRAVFFTNDTTGYIAGANGVIYRTDNGGQAWVLQPGGVSVLMCGLYFINTDTGYACGGGGVILKTTNGGSTWIPQSSGTLQDLINITFINADTGFCVSSPTTLLNGLVLRTFDGGLNWVNVHTDTFGLLTVFAIDTTIYAGGANQAILKSTDLGSTWTLLHSSPPLTSAFRGSYFLSSDTWYIAGDSGRIFYTADGGANWVNQSFNYYSLYSVFCPSADTCYAVGYNYALLRYTKPCIPDPASAIFGNTVACANDTLTYYAAPVPGTTYYWWQVPGGGAAIISGQGDTLVTVKLGTASGNIAVIDFNNFGKSNAKTLFVTVNPTPPVPVISLNGGTLISSPLQEINGT